MTDHAMLANTPRTAARIDRARPSLRSKVGTPLTPVKGTVKHDRDGAWCITERTVVDFELVGDDRIFSFSLDRTDQENVDANLLRATGWTSDDEPVLVKVAASCRQHVEKALRNERDDAVSFVGSPRGSHDSEGTSSPASARSPVKKRRRFMSLMRAALHLGKGGAKDVETAASASGPSSSPTHSARGSQVGDVVDMDTTA